MKKLFYAILACSLAFFAACDNEELNQLLNGGGTDQVKISLDRESAELTVGETLQLAVTVEPQLPAGPKVIWSSSDPDVATVTTGDEVAADGTYLPAGLVTAVAEGEATITASIEGKEATCTVTVKKGSVAVSEIKLDRERIEIEIGKSEQLTATVLPEDASDKTVTWSSSDDNVATVEDGMVTGISAGSARIQASAGGLSAFCSVTVKKGGAAGDKLIITPDKVTVLKNEKVQLSVTDADGNSVKATWSTSDNMVAVVDGNNILEARNPGSAIVTAEADGKTGTCEVTVTDEIPVQSIAFDPDYIEMNVGDERQLTVVFTPENATHKTINVWTVDGGNPAVSVNENGVVKALIAGRTAVVVAAVNSELIARCTIKIVDPDNPDIPVESIVLDKTEATVTVGQTEPLILTATVTPADALNSKSIEWKSDNPKVVTVQRINDTQAKVAGVAAGTASVSANIGGKSASCQVTVEAPPTVEVEGITLDKTSLDMVPYQSYTLTATVTPANATNKTVSWSSSNPDVAKVLNEDGWGADGSMAKAGTVTAYKAGEAVITASVGHITAQCTVTVTSNTVSVTSVTLNKHELQLAVGEQFQLVATVMPENATEKGVVWSSSVQVSKLYIDETGLVKGVQACTATVTVRCKDNPYIYDTCQITVTGGSSETGDEVVDLGLPSGLKWRSMNVGASKPEDYGNYYAWAETSPKSSYSSSNYKYPATNYGDGIIAYAKYDTTPYQGDGKTVLEPEDDAATANLGNGWRTPTFKEWKELRENCTWTWKTQNGVNGMLVTGPNGKSIFLPAGGWYENSTLKNKTTYGSYWTATGDGGTANAVDFINNDKDKALVPRCEGRSIRPVKD